jgi:WD40 repeat protein
LKALSKSLKLEKQTRLSYSAKKRLDKKKEEGLMTANAGGAASLFGPARALGGAPADAKGKVLCMAYMEKYRQLVFCSSDCYITFCEVRGIGEGRDFFHVVGHIVSDEPQQGICYLPGAELLLTWSGESSENHAFQVWDPFVRALRYQVLRHDAIILTACAFALPVSIGEHSSAIGERVHKVSGYLPSSSVAHFVVSSSLDRKVVLWSASPLVAAMSGFDLKDVPGEKVLLRGHFHAIRFLSFAPVHELVLGGGFDHEIYAWSPRTRSLHLKLSGHINTLVAVHIVSVPQERVISVDDKGVVKLWSLDGPATKMHDAKGEMQSMQLICPQPANIYDCAGTFDNGEHPNLWLDYFA